MRGRDRWWLGLGVLILVSGLAVVQAPSGWSSAPTPDAVIALVDSGINPYHETFRDTSPRAYKHPSTYIPGYPKDAQALHLTFGADYWASVRADCGRIWSGVLDKKLYWVPGTRIVGAISFDIRSTPDCRVREPHGHGVILDSLGHGTMVASRAASREYGACRGCLIVAVEGWNSASIDWAAANSHWIDAQSNSWGPVYPFWTPVEPSVSVPTPVGDPTKWGTHPAFVRAVERTSAAHLSLWASGNGVLTRRGVLGHPTLAVPHLTPSVVVVGGHDSGYMNTWPGFPAHVVSDSCAAWAAEHHHASKSGDRLSGGTSGATPFAGGIALEILRTARQILGWTDTGVHAGVVARGRAGVVRDGPLADGVFTLEEWKRLLFVTATPRPARQREDGPTCFLLSAPFHETPVRWVDVPPQYPEYVQIGYGAADQPALELARRVLRGEIPAPARTSTDQFFARDRQIRTTTYEVFSKP